MPSARPSPRRPRPRRRARRTCGPHRSRGRPARGGCSGRSCAAIIDGRATWCGAVAGQVRHPPYRIRDNRAMGGGTRTHALPPGPASPGPWQLIRCQADFAGYLDACVRRHGPLFTLRMPPFEAFVAATEPRDVETILLDTTTRFEPGAASAILEPLVGPASLILSSGPQHMRQRKSLLPAFHGGLAERWEHAITEIAERHLARLPLETPIALRE